MFSDSQNLGSPTIRWSLAASLILNLSFIFKFSLIGAGCDPLLLLFCVRFVLTQRGHGGLSWVFALVALGTSLALAGVVSLSHVVS
jgi:hypothetical protein